MQLLLNKLNISIEHLKCLDEVFNECHIEYHRIEKIFATAPFSDILEEISRELYAGGKTAPQSVLKLNRQMILGDVIEYIFSGRAYYYAAKSEENLKYFYKLILYSVNQMLIYDTITVNPWLRKCYIDKLENKLPKNILYEKANDDQIANSLKDSTVRIWDTNWTNEIDAFIDSILPKTLGAPKELIVFVEFIRLGIGMVIPLLLIQRIFGDKNPIAPPDFLILMRNKEIYGIEVGFKKELQSREFSIRTSIPTFAVDLKNNLHNRCPKCGENILYCDKVIDAYSDGTLWNKMVNSNEVILVTQSSSEHSICLAIAPGSARTAREKLEIEFRVELHLGQISTIAIEDDSSIVAVVGENVQNIPGVIGKVFEALGRNGINPRAIAFGSSERILGLVLSQNDLGKAMNALHDRLFLSRLTTLNLFLIGPGTVGSALLELLQDQKEYAETSLGIQFKVVGITNSRAMYFEENGIDLAQWRTFLTSSNIKCDPDEFTAAVKRFNAANSIVIDCTGAEISVGQYLPLLNSSVSLITSSKIANTLSYDFYKQLRTAVELHGAEFRYSTNVGAALPVIESIKSIINNGDVIERIEAVLSGTLSFIFNQVNSGKRFSKAVTEAQARGYSEPDPRTDLSGMDVARKLLIIIREAGVEMEMDDIIIEPYLPESVFNTEDLPSALSEADIIIGERYKQANRNGSSLMYIARYENGKAQIGLEEINADHPFYHLSGNDNIVSLTTRSLYKQPFIVRGGGAGARLTAAGLFNDIVHLSHSMR